MSERLNEIKSVFNQWCRGKGGELDKEDAKWLIEQAEKIERYEKALDKIATRKMSTYLSSSHMNQDFIKTATEALMLEN